MKYIRTKHTIFEVVGENEKVYYVRAKSDPTSIYSKSKCQTDIVEKGEIIEELCDEFVVVATDRDKPFLYTLKEPINSPIFDNKEETVYGAIWTNNGLKYVAKLNNKGELELL